MSIRDDMQNKIRIQRVNEYVYIVHSTNLNIAKFQGVMTTGYSSEELKSFFLAA